MKKLQMTDTFIEDISLEDFRVVPADIFSDVTDPVMTLYNDSFAFSTQAHRALNNCDNIQIMINIEKRQIVIKPSTSKEDDILCWKSNSNNTNFKRFRSFSLVTQVFGAWNLNPKLKYKANGRLVKSDHKVMLLFDFTNADAYERNNKKTKQPE